MLLSKLPPGLREMAQCRQIDYPMGNPKGPISHLGSAFVWDWTPEGFDFWSNIALGNYSVYCGCKVTNLKLKTTVTP
ncbi:hypothetical protein SAMN04487996_107128 [Dyadobacter soli]|uniref:Uncharacterized protein n=1 Tax=Dyadobacter soli TaxID=659014 RepID=A0A1G7G553_9BACT|nr:hypothetical protein SAMN04487996_107128 [Dyadobacter soli]